MRTRPIDTFLGCANMRCAKFGAPMGACDCWTECRCGWSFEKGTECGNPRHTCEAAADQAATFIASSVILDMQGRYPEPMRHASGGFSKTLRGVVRDEAYRMVLEILLTPSPDVVGHKAPAPRSSRSPGATMKTG